MAGMLIRSLRRAPGEQRTPELDADQLLAGTCLAALLGLLLVLAAVA